MFSTQPQTSMIPTFLFFLVLIPPASPLQFNLSPITNTDGGSFNFSDAYINGGIQLITNDRNEVQTYRLGRATYKEPLHLWDRASRDITDFSTNFSFVIDSNGNPDYADGMTFFLAPLYRQDWILGDGIGLGKPNSTSSSSSSSESFVAVEFDTFLNAFDPPYAAEPFVQYPHVGIDINNLTSVNATPWHNNITAGPQNNASITYNATSMMLVVVFTGQNNSITQGGSLSYKVDLRDYLPEYVAVGFSAGTGTRHEQNVIKSWSFSSTLNFNHRGNKKGLILGLSVGTSLLILGLALAFYFIWKKNSYKGLEEEHFSDTSMDNDFEQGTGPRKFSYDELVLATDNFADEKKLGQGGFGGVYRGFLTAINTYIAVKKVSKGSKQGRKEYAAEVKVISQLRHINLVQLLGWCHQRTELLLVYEFMPNGSLDSHLFKLNSLLTWEMRYKIAQGLASALLYLHEELRQYVVHRDIKSSNIMLDANFNTKLGDFGLARLVDHDKDSQTTEIPAGTIGYMAPEYPVAGRASKETDIYSFGIVLLEIACGRKPIDHRFPENQIVLVEWVWSLYGAGQLLDAADAKVDSTEFDASKIERLMVVGLWCVHPDSRQRPTIKQAMQVLNCEAPLPSLPPAMPKAVYNALEMVTVSGGSNAHSGSGTSSAENPSNSATLSADSSWITLPR